MSPELFIGVAALVIAGATLTLNVLMARHKAERDEVLDIRDEMERIADRLDDCERARERLMDENIALMRRLVALETRVQ